MSLEFCSFFFLDWSKTRWLYCLCSQQSHHSQFNILTPPPNTHNQEMIAHRGARWIDPLMRPHGDTQLYFCRVKNYSQFIWTAVYMESQPLKVVVQISKKIEKRKKAKVCFFCFHCVCFHCNIWPSKLQPSRRVENVGSYLERMEIIKSIWWREGSKAAIKLFQ